MSLICYAEIKHYDFLFQVPILFHALFQHSLARLVLTLSLTFPASKMQKSLNNKPLKSFYYTVPVASCVTLCVCVCLPIGPLVEKDGAVFGS